MRQRRPQQHHGPHQRRPRVNEQIMAREVLLISDGGKPERLPVADALARARAEEFDLIEVAAEANPPVVKIGDFGSYLYQMQKKEKRQRSGSKQSGVKTVRLGFRTDVGDVARLASRAREFFGENHMVKASIILRGRELTNKAYAIDKLKNFLQSLNDVAEVEQEIKRQGNQFIAVLKPRRK